MLISIVEINGGLQHLWYETSSIIQANPGTPPLWLALWLGPLRIGHQSTEGSSLLRVCGVAWAARATNSTEMGPCLGACLRLETWWRLLSRIEPHWCLITTYIFCYSSWEQSCIDHAADSCRPLPDPTSPIWRNNEFWILDLRALIRIILWFSSFFVTSLRVSRHQLLKILLRQNDVRYFPRILIQKHVESRGPASSSFKLQEQSLRLWAWEWMLISRNWFPELLHLKQRHSIRGKEQVSALGAHIFIGKRSHTQIRVNWPMVSDITG